MTANPITPILRERIVSRLDTTLRSAWVHRPVTVPRLRAGDWLQTAGHTDLSPGDAPVLVMLRGDAGPLEPLLDALPSHQGRLYVLVDAAGVGSPRLKALVAHRRVLVRQIPEVPVSAVWTEGAAFVALSSELDMRLNEDGSVALRHLFLRLFWHDASREAWTEDGRLSWRAALGRPFDVPSIGLSASMRPVTVPASLGDNTAADVVLLHGDRLPQRPPRRIWTEARSDQHSSLAKLVDAGSEVVWDALDLPELRLEPIDDGEVLLSGRHGRLCLRLASKQAAELRAVLDRPTPWTFHTGLCIGEEGLQQSQLWLEQEPAARSLVPEEVCALGDVSCPDLRTMREMEPSVYPPADVLSLSVRYTWNVVPPRVPRAAKEAELVTAWRAVDEDWRRRLEVLRKELGSVEALRGRVSSTFARLKSAMMGLGRKRSSMEAELAALELCVPSAVEAGTARSWADRLVTLEANVRELSDDIVSAEKAAREEVAREAQERAWQADVDAARVDLTAAIERLSKAQAEQARLGDEVRRLTAAVKDLPKREGADDRTRLRSRRDSLKRTKRTVGNVSAECLRLEERIAAPFRFRPPVTPAVTRPRGASFVPDAPAVRRGPPIPSEALPEVGDLRVHDGKRYLVIGAWSELDAGEATARRLSAELVAPEVS